MKTQPIYAPAVAFIRALRKQSVPLRVFVTSDWHSAPAYVYLDIRGQRLADGRRSWSEKLCHRYARLDHYGQSMALRWYLRNIDPSSCHL